MEEWIDILIFAAVIIANIVGAVIKLKQKRKAARKLDLPPQEKVDIPDDNFFAEEEEEEEYSFNETHFEQSYAAEQQIENIERNHAAPAPFPQTTAANAPCHECPPETSDNFCSSQSFADDEEDDDSFDYGEFMRQHGREAFILTEIILPANSRQRS